MDIYGFGRRHRRLGVLSGAVAMLLASLVQVRHPGVFLAFGPAAGIALAAAGGAIAKGIAARRAGGYQPSRGILRRYERLEAGDINRLYGNDPYSGKDLGFNPTQMAAQYGEQADESQAQTKGDLAQIEQATRGQNLKTVSGAYFRGKQRAGEAGLAREADIRRRNIIADAAQRRQDYAFRLASVGQAYRGGASMYYKKPNWMLDTAGNAAIGAASAYGQTAGGGRAA